jgi:single-strand DNA-binding protein
MTLARSQQVARGARLHEREVKMPHVNINQVVLAGNLTRDPEVRYLPSGTPAAKISLAVNNRIKKGNEWVDDPCYVDVTVFGHAAERVGKDYDKGQSVCLTGRLQFRSWEDKNGGGKRSKLDVIADRIWTLSPVNGGKSSREPGADDEPMDDDRVPF